METISLKELAQKFGYSYSTISKWVSKAKRQKKFKKKSKGYHYSQGEVNQLARLFGIV